MYTKKNSLFVSYDGAVTNSAETEKTTIETPVNQVEMTQKRISEIMQDLQEDTKNATKGAYEKLQKAITGNNKNTLKSATQEWTNAVETFVMNKTQAEGAEQKAAIKAKLDQLRTIASSNNPEDIVKSVADTTVAEMKNLPGDIQKVMTDGANEVQEALFGQYGEMQKEVAKKGKMGALGGLFGFDAAWVADKYRAASEAKKSGGFTGRIESIFSLIFAKIIGKVMGIKMSDIQENMTTEELKDAGLPVPDGREEGKGNEQKEMKESVNNQIDNIAMNQTAKFFISRTKEREYEGTFSAFWEGLKDATWGKDEQQRKNHVRSTATKILTWTSFSKNSVEKVFSAINTKDKEEAARILGVTTSQEDELVSLQYALMSIGKNKDFITKVMQKQYPNWKNMTWEDFIKTFYKHAGVKAVNDITDAFNNIDFQDDVAGSLKSVFSNILITGSEDGRIGGIVGEQLSSLESEGINKEVLGTIFLGGANGDTTVEDYRTTLKNNNFEEQKSQQKMEELAKKGGFSKSILEMMNQVGLEKFENLKDGENITMSELISIYAVSGGNTNLDKMTPGQRAQVIPILYKIAARTNPGDLTVVFLTGLVGKANENKYAQEIGQLFGESLSNGVYVATLTSFGIAKEIVEKFIEMRHTNPKTFYGAIGILTISGLIATRFKGLLVKGPIFVGVASAIISGAVAFNVGK